mmetsp:Transcript_11298/g.21138  ORF Transcript_11298/g.21138 Transcript_11298/m.21138 type:complete len:191 (-) Transcript_11298:1102-1674(-)
MVRHKSRWLLIRIEYESEVKNISRRDITATATNASSSTAPTDSHMASKSPSTFSSSQQGLDTTLFQKPTELFRIHLYHSIRCTMEDAFGIAACGITEDIQVVFYNTDTGLAIVKVSRDSCNLVRSAITIMMQVNNVPMVATVISTNGSVRTAKLAAIREIKRMFRESDAVPTQERLKKLEEHMDQVHCVE